MSNYWQPFCIFLVAYFVPFGHEIFALINPNDTFGMANAIRHCEYKSQTGMVIRNDRLYVAIDDCGSYAADIGEAVPCTHSDESGCVNYGIPGFEYSDDSGKYTFDGKTCGCEQHLENSETSYSSST